MRSRCTLATTLAGALALAACTTTRNVAPAGLASARAQALSASRAWTLRDDSNEFGRVVLFVAEERAPVPCASFYSVQNLRGQELGLIDVQGRAWRYEVHEREARWLSTGTLVAGARAILGGGADAVLIDAPLATGLPDKTAR